jgi:flavodoxin I
MKKVLVIYDSVFGNTAKVAEAIGKALEGSLKVEVKHVKDVDITTLKTYDILFVGSPTRGFRPTEGIQGFLKNLSKDMLKGVKTAAFDTRIALSDIKSGFLRFIVKLGGYADKIIARKLAKAGAQEAIASTGFAVEDTEGPLKEGELERAADWAEVIL